MVNLEGAAGHESLAANDPEYQRKFADYQVMTALLGAFNREGLDIRIADFLEYDAKVALQTMVAIFKAHDIQPGLIPRGFTRGFNRSYQPIQSAGWLIARNANEFYSGTQDKFETVTKQLIVTPNNLILSNDTPEMLDSDSVEIPSFEEFEGGEYIYKFEFVTSTIVESVMAQIRAHGLEFTEPDL
ncbi:MAG: hypothetical protein ABSB12_02990 [Candidatus Saccharimonadales bacterium]|jgi:hypothetical protein